MRNFTKPLTKIGRIAAVTIFLLQTTLLSAFAQISRTSDKTKPDSRKVRREAAKYAKKNNAEDYTVSHLNMKMFSFRKGEPAQPRVTEEMEYDEVYQGVNPVVPERKLFRRFK